MARRTLAYGVVCVGLITTLTAMAALHPHEQVYFNGMVDTKTPGALAERYDIDYWWVARRQAVEYLLARYPNDALRVYLASVNPNTLILPKNDRDRIAFSPSHEADFYVSLPPNRWDVIGGLALHSIRAYGNAISVIYAPNSDEYRNERRAAYNDAETNGTPLTRGDFDVYAHNGALYYLNANCEPPMADAFDDVRFFQHIIPADPADLPAASRESGFENRDFRVRNMRSAYFDGKCVIKRALPDYAIAIIRTGQKATSGGGDGWRADINLVARAAAQAAYDGIAAGEYGQPVAQSGFDVYMRGDRLAYVKEDCSEGDVGARFFLHIVPVNPADLPGDGRERGFVNMDFQFGHHGAYEGDICLATRELPAYPIDRIRTGQFVSGEGAIWRAEFPAAR